MVSMFNFLNIINLVSFQAWSRPTTSFQLYAISHTHTVFIKVCNTAHKTDCRRKKPPKFVPLKLEICLNYAFRQS